MLQQTTGVNSFLEPAQLPLGEDSVKCKNLVKIWSSVQHMDRDCPCFMGHTSSEARNARRPRAIKLIITNELLHFVDFTVRLSWNHLFASNAV